MGGCFHANPCYIALYAAHVRSAKASGLNRVLGEGPGLIIPRAYNILESDFDYQFYLHMFETFKERMSSLQSHDVR